LAKDPTLLLRLFEMLARHGFELGRDAERAVTETLVRDFPSLAKEGARGWLAGALSYPPPPNPSSVEEGGHLASEPALLWEHFRRILLLPYAAKALRDMNRLGVLSALFPEFHVIDSLVIRDFFHRYTVDEHSFMTIQNLHALGSSRRHSQGQGDSGSEPDWEGRLAEILSELEQPELLYLALLFHDIGKGMEDPDHIVGSLKAIERIMARLDVKEPDRDMVRFLIGSHLEMSATLQRRDIFDPETVRQFAAKMETSERLKMLCLLTYADVKSVNPEALTPWKAELLWRLYAATANYLARSADEERLKIAATTAWEKVLRLLPSSPEEEVKRFLEGFPRRYLATHTPEEIASHFQLAQALSQAPVQLHLRAGASLPELTVITRDRPSLFASITGTLAGWGMSIVKADAYANAAGVILDTFRFVDLYRTLELNPSEADRFRSNLVDVLQGRMQIVKMMSGRILGGTSPNPKVIIPTQIRFDDSSSSHSTLLELTTQDRPGLLYQVSSALAELRCNIEIALIDTEGEKVIDVFYLTFEGRKLELELQGAVRESLLTKLA
jgi:[protein-PII] uridylyltransferase